MPGFDMATATWGYPVWAAGAAAALFVVVAALALRRSGLGGLATTTFRAAVLTIAVGGVWLFLDRTDLNDRAAERRALDQRNAELALRAMAPGSMLGCLNAMAGDAVETACEKTLFANPETAAAAVEYVAARLSLLADGIALARRGEAGFEAALTTLRLGLETDRFGIVAHVLSVRDNCTPLQCDGLALFKDPSRVQTNLKGRVFEGYVSRYAADWQARPPKNGAPAAESGPVLSGTSAAAPPPGVPLNPKYDFPSASSIPPVSIMNPEPGAPPAASAPPPKPAAAVPIPAPRKPPPRANAAARPSTPSPPPPAPIGPPPSATAGATPGAALR